MGILLSDTSRLLLLVGMWALLSVFEGIFPLFQYRRSRIRRAVPNMELTLLVVLTNLGLSFVSISLSSYVVEHRFGLLYAIAMPEWLKLLTGVLILDLGAYLAHVMMHHFNIGWRFHRVHHSEPEVDVTTALRQHPIESLWRIAWQVAAIGLLGLPMKTVLLYLVMSAANAQVEHANIRVSSLLDRVVRWIVVTPNMHKVHHSRLQMETDTNYSNIFSFWDRVFGTYKSPDRLSQIKYGLNGYDDERKQTLTSLLKAPWNSATTGL